MKDTFGKKQYQCKCGCVMEDYVWKSQIEKHKVACFKCGNTLEYKNLVVKKAAESAAIRTPTKNR